MADWLSVAALGLVAGAAIGLVAAAMQAAYVYGRRLDLLPAVAAAAAALGAARLAGESQLDRLVGGLVLVPAAVLIGLLVQLLVADRPVFGGLTTRRVVVPLALAVLGSAVLTWWASGRDFPAALRAGGLRFRGVSVFTWTEVIAGLVAIVSVGLLSVVARRGRTGLRLRAERDVPELLPLVGVDPVRLDARMAGARAAAGAIGGLVLSVTGHVPSPDLGDVGVRAGEGVLVGGVGHPAGALAGGLVVELTRALGERARQGWGPAAGHILTLVVAMVRLMWGRTIRPAEVDVVEEQLA